MIREVVMNRRFLISNSILWAAAMIASAIVGAPAVLSTVLLPSLATLSILMARSGSGAAKCGA